MRFARYPKHRLAGSQISKRRISVAKKAIEKEKQSWGLFADIAEPTYTSPEERISRMDFQAWCFWQAMRDSRASQWHAVRSALYSLDSAQRNAVLEDWEHCLYPSDPIYMSIFLRKFHSIDVVFPEYDISERMHYYFQCNQEERY
jgi:hypothetical protein